MEYLILRSTNVEGLEELIRKAFEDGYQLQGGVSLATRENNDLWYAQAIIKVEG